jgi:ATP-dependent DNA helicase RecG
MDAHSRRATALAAIQRVLSGARPDALESQVLDFKEESGTVQPDGTRQAIPPQHEPAARVLAEEAACFANSSTGGVLIVGVHEREAGPAAFVGASLDTVWLRERIHALTQPHLSVDLIEELTVAGRRIYLINVAPALEEIRCGGRLRARFGRRCDELSGDQARQLLESRRRYDWTAEPSGMRLSQAMPAALELARRFYRDEHGRIPPSTLALVAQLGLTVGDGSTDDRAGAGANAEAGAGAGDPQLNTAGALLLCAYEPSQVQIDVLVTRVEGQPSHMRLERPAPLLVAFDDALRRLLDAFPAQPIIAGAQRREVRAVPQRASREALVNALMHRDYRQPRGRVVVTVIGTPATTLKVRSPGGFPAGVTADRLLTTPSRPRNPVLAQALHTLGLAEREGIGIDAMYLEMLRDGHPAPEIAEDAGDVLCVLRGGRADASVRAFFDELSARDPDLGDDVRAYIAITLLLGTTPLRPEPLAAAAQCTLPEALDTLERLAQAGAIERLLDGSRSFRLSRTARDRLRARVAYPPRVSLDERWETIRAYLDATPEIGRAQAAALLGVTPVQAARILSDLYHERGAIEPVGNPRGRGVRYRLATPT